ncbi:MAG: hypothetical protein U0271_13390 [Polyangiaceae bacterium]
MVAACGDDGTGGSGGNPTTGGGGQGGNPMTGGAGGVAQSGGMGGMGGDVGGGPPTEVTVDAAGTDVDNPLDAAPDADGTNIYFTAVDAINGAGVYRVAASGGASTALYRGDPLASPFGVAVSTDNSLVFVADAASVTGPADADDAGQIFSLETAGGSPTTVSGTAGYKPIMLEVFNDGAVDHLFFSGHSPQGAPGVYRVPANGGSVEVVREGSPFVDPSGVVVATNGDLYVIDTNSLGAELSSVYRITNAANGNDTASELVVGLTVGFPAGIALNKAEDTLYVSGFDPGPNTDVLIQIDIGTGTQSYIKGDADTDLGLFEESAGLHRAKLNNTFAWADSKSPNSGSVARGTVFTIALP